MSSETAKWLKSREDWLRVVAIPSPYGGFDVALVIDGSYSLDAGPQRVVRGHAERLMEVLAADGLPLGRPTGVGVRARVDSREQDAARRETARRHLNQAIADRDLDGMFDAMGEILGARRDEVAERTDGTASECRPASRVSDEPRLSGLPLPSERSEALTDAHSAPPASTTEETNRP